MKDIEKDLPRDGNTCSQSRIVSVGYLHLWRTEQVEAALALSVVVRSGPLEAVVNGRLVPCQSWFA
jgi:hypothetical protein